jgi:hypothetical protein
VLLGERPKEKVDRGALRAGFVEGKAEIVWSAITIRLFGVIT